MDTLQIIGRGRTAKVYRDGDKAIKFFLNTPYEEVLAESKNQKFAYNLGLPVPEVYGVTERDGGVAFEMEYIEASASGPNPKNKINVMLEKFILLQNRINSINTTELPKFEDKLRSRIENSVLLHDELKESLLERINLLSKNSNNMCHGDMHPNNLIEKNGEFWIIDWVDAARGDPAIDACRTFLIYKQYIPRLAGTYSRRFCKLASNTQEEILNWLPIMAAARLEEADGENPRNFLMGVASDSRYLYNEDLYKQL